MTKGRKSDGEGGHFTYHGDHAELTRLGEILIEEKERIIYLKEIRDELVLKTREIISKRSSGVASSCFELPEDYKKHGIDANISFLRVLAKEIKAKFLENNNRINIENVEEVLRFIDYVEMLIVNEISQLTDNDPQPKPGQKYLNSPPPKRPKSHDYPYDDGLEPDWPDDDTDEWKNGA